MGFLRGCDQLDDENGIKQHSTYDWTLNISHFKRTDLSLSDILLSLLGIFWVFLTCNYCDAQFVFSR